MARFYGTVQGKAGEASRLGSVNSGMRTTACSWQGRVVVLLRPDDKTDKDMIILRAERHGNSSNPQGPFFVGTFDELGQLIDWWERRDEINAVLALLDRQPKIEVGEDTLRCLVEVAEVGLADLDSGLADGTYEDDSIGGYAGSTIRTAIDAANRAIQLGRAN